MIIPGYLPYGRENSAPFTGSFMGSGHTLSNLHFNNNVFLGLFGCTGPAALIENLAVSLTIISGGSFSGGIVA
jgi:hypothetical protein